jgi:hypothetical protein
VFSHEVLAGAGCATVTYALHLEFTNLPKGSLPITWKVADHEIHSLVMNTGGSPEHTAAVYNESRSISTLFAHDKSENQVSQQNSGITFMIKSRNMIDVTLS